MYIVQMGAKSVPSTVGPIPADGYVQTYNNVTWKKLNTDTNIRVFWNINTEYRTDFKNTEKPKPNWNTDTNPPLGQLLWWLLL